MDEKKIKVGDWVLKERSTDVLCVESMPIRIEIVTPSGVSGFIVNDDGEEESMRFMKKSIVAVFKSQESAVKAIDEIRSEWEKIHADVSLAKKAHKLKVRELIEIHGGCNAG